MPHADPTYLSMPSGGATYPLNRTGAVCAEHLDVIKWTESGETKRFHLIEKIKYQWHDIGLLTGQSLAQLHEISLRYHEPVESCRYVLRTWLDNTPDEYPITWSGIIELLKHASLDSVATELKTVLSMASLS